MFNILTLIETLTLFWSSIYHFKTKKHWKEVFEEKHQRNWKDRRSTSSQASEAQLRFVQMAFLSPGIKLLAQKCTGDAFSINLWGEFDVTVENFILFFFTFFRCRARLTTQVENSEQYLVHKNFHDTSQKVEISCDEHNHEIITERRKYGSLKSLKK